MFVCAGAAGLRWFLTHSWWFLQPPERSPQSRVCQRQQPQQQAGSEGRAAEAEGRGGGGTGARGGGRAETGHQRGEREGGGGRRDNHGNRQPLLHRFEHIYCNFVKQYPFYVCGPFTQREKWPGSALVLYHLTFYRHRKERHRIRLSNVNIHITYWCIVLYNNIHTSYIQKV